MLHLSWVAAAFEIHSLAAVLVILKFSVHGRDTSLN